MRAFFLLCFSSATVDPNPKKLIRKVIVKNFPRLLRLSPALVGLIVIKTLSTALGAYAASYGHLAITPNSSPEYAQYVSLILQIIPFQNFVDRQIMDAKTDIIIDLQRSSIIFYALTKKTSFYLENSTENIQAAIVGIPENVAEYIESYGMVIVTLITTILHYLALQFPNVFLPCFPSDQRQKHQNVIFDIAIFGLIMLYLQYFRKSPAPSSYEYNNEVQDVIDNAILIQTSNREQYEAKRMENFYVTQHKQKQKSFLSQLNINAGLAFMYIIIGALKTHLHHNKTTRGYKDLLTSYIREIQIIANMAHTLDVMPNLKRIESELTWQLKLIEEGKAPKPPKPLRELKIKDPKIEISIEEFSYP